MLTDAEAELLLVCARQSLTTECRQRAIELLEQPLRWRAVTGDASRHGVAPLLFHHLETLQQTATVRPEHMHLFRQAYVRAAFRSRIHEEAIAELLARFKENGIKITLLKGAGLARTVYRDPALRPFADIDLLAAENDIDRAKEILVRAGYVIAPELLSEKFNRSYHTNLPFVRVDPVPVHIELHWKLSDRFSDYRFDEVGAAQRAFVSRSGDNQAPVFLPEDNLVYLAAHLHNHGYLNAVAARNDFRAFVLHPLSGNRLIWFTDLHELIVAGLDWTAVTERAKTANATGALAVSLRLLTLMIGTRIDPDMLRELAMPPVRWPKRVLARYVFSLAKTEPASAAAQRFENQLLSTRRGFELRLVRLFDLWEYVFRRGHSPNHPAEPMHSARALARLGNMFLKLVYYHLLIRQRQPGR